MSIITIIIIIILFHNQTLPIVFEFTHLKIRAFILIMPVSAVEHLHYSMPQISPDCFAIFPLAAKLIWHVRLAIRLKQVTCD